MPQRPPTFAAVFRQALCGPAMTGLLAGSAFGLAPASALAAGPDLAADDAALIAHIKKTDYVFSLALGRCSGERLTRHREGGMQRFEYTAFCSARAARESDCPGFDVKARGTVDSPTWATVRTQVLTLKCSG
jgi:hypothetical protein